MIRYTAAQQIMLDDGCPEFMIRTEENHQAYKEAWINNPPVSKPVFYDPKLEASRLLRMQQRQAEADRRRAKENAKPTQNKVSKVDTTGLRWDQRRAKWIADDNVKPQEDEMGIAGVTLYSSRASARKGARRAGALSFTIVQDGDKFKFVTAAQLMTDSAKESVETSAVPAPAAVQSETQVAETEVAAMAKKKSKSNGAGPSKAAQVMAMCERKVGCTVEDIMERLAVTKQAAASLIADVRRARKSLKRERLEGGVSTYYL